MNNEDLKKQIAAIVEKQVKIATYCMDESLFPDSFQTEIQNCFNVIIEKTDALVDDFEPNLNFQDVLKWIDDHTLNWRDEREILEKLSDAEVGDYYTDHVKKDNNEIVINCDSIVQRERIKNFLETEVFTDLHRYNAAVDNL